MVDRARAALVDRAAAAVGRLPAAEAARWVALLERLAELDDAALDAAELDDRALLFLGSDQQC